MIRKKEDILKEAVVILPYKKDKVLLQLRDNKSGIAYPGSWGFFSGTIEFGEFPIDSAKRELYEEIGYKPKEIFYLSKDCILTPHKIKLYAFYCPLNVSLVNLKLCEGFDFGFFNFEEILSKNLFSNKTKKSYPLINNPYMEYLVKKLRRRIGINKTSKNKIE